jgi:biopolymer transport protein ExbD/biopolymer transport protein TolR
MAMNMTASSGGGRRGRRRAIMAEINVTPMVDVMLVLLIIFMVAAPLLTVNIQIDLPVATGGTPAVNDTVPLTVSVKKTAGECNSKVDLYLGDTLVPAEELGPKIKAIKEAKAGGDSVAYIRGDRDVCYTEMMKVLGWVRGAGYRANIVILPEQGS